MRIKGSIGIDPLRNVRLLQASAYYIAQFERLL